MSNTLIKNNAILSFLLFICFFSNAINNGNHENKKNKTNSIISSQQINLQDSNSIKDFYNNDFLKFDLVSETKASSNNKSNKIAIKMNALIITGTISPAFEYKFSNHFSGHIQLIGVYQPKGFMGTNKPLSLFSILIEPRYYPIQTFYGLFFGLNVGFSSFDMARSIIANHWQEPFDNVHHKGWNIMGGLSLGWSFPVGDNLGIEPFITTGCTYSNWHNYVNKELATEGVGKSKLDFVYAYNGGLNVIYRFGYSPYSKMMGPSKHYRGSKYNRRIYRKFNKKYYR